MIVNGRPLECAIASVVVVEMPMSIAFDATADAIEALYGFGESSTAMPALRRALILRVEHLRAELVGNVGDAHHG